MQYLYLKIFIKYILTGKDNRGKVRVNVTTDSVGQNRQILQSEEKNQVASRRLPFHGTKNRSAFGGDGSCRVL